MGDGIIFSVILTIIFGILFAVYLTCGIVLTKLHKLKYGKGNILAWIPYCNYYLLGKLTVNKYMGWGLASLAVLSTALSSTLAMNLVGNTMTLAKVRASVSELTSSLSFILLIYAIVEYFDLKKKQEGNNEKITNSQSKTIGTDNPPKERQEAE